MDAGFETGWKLGLRLHENVLENIKFDIWKLNEQN